MQQAVVIAARLGTPRRKGYSRLPSELALVLHVVIHLNTSADRLHVVYNTLDVAAISENLAMAALQCVALSARSHSPAAREALSYQRFICCY